MVVLITQVNSLAQTYPQLMNQLRDCGYSQEEMERVREVFELALRFSDGIYRASGVPLVQHLIRTASILIVEKQSLKIVIVGLLHAAFVLSRFESSLRSTGTRRQRLDLELIGGEEIIRTLQDYEAIGWYSEDELNEHLHQIHTYGDSLRSLLVVRLANELEDRLDHASDYDASDTEAERSVRRLEKYVALAEQLDLDFLVENFKLILDQSRELSVPDSLTRPYFRGYEMPEKRMWRKSGIRILAKSILSWIKKLSPI